MPCLLIAITFVVALAIDADNCITDHMDTITPVTLSLIHKRMSTLLNKLYWPHRQRSCASLHSDISPAAQSRRWLLPVANLVSAIGVHLHGHGP